jgi:hypothetical protein
MRRRITALVLATLATTAVFCLAQEEQATPQPQVIRHWSPYEYPTAFPPGARVYIIVSGDTLWDISKRTYNNPLLWPQIHSANTYIGNPHWIYPGDPLVLPELAVAEAGKVAEARPEAPAVEERPAEAVPTAEGEHAEEAAQPEPPAKITEERPRGLEEGVIFETQPRPSFEYESAATEMDLYCSSVVYPARLDTGLWIADREFTDQIEMSEGDIVYLNAGEGHVNPGDVFIAANEQGPVKHPHSGKFIGIAYQEVGQVRVILVSAETAVAEVITACDGLAVGSVLTPFKPRPNPVSRVRETMPVIEQYQLTEFSPVGCIIRTNYESLEAGVGDVINIDLGAEDGLKVGDRCYIFNEKPVKLTSKSRKSVNDNAHGTTSVQRVIGEAIVYLVLDKTACAKITYLVDFPLLGYYVAPVPSS